MQKKRMCLLIVVGILFIIVGINVMKIWRVPSAVGIFSWKKTAVIEKEKFFKDVEKLGVTEVYQEISSSFPIEEIEAFLGEAAEKEIDVYLLTGEPEWALQKDAEGIKRVVDRVVWINSAVQGDEHINGIMVDVEPYTLEEWNEDSSGVMDIFVASMKSAYAYALEKDVKMILCIPYFYDKKGFEKELEVLIAQACDGIAVMNYYRDSEILNIKQEVAFVAKYGKSIMSIYEMKAAGTHGLTEKNTYAHLGFQAVEDNFKQLYKAYKNQKPMMAYHDYEAVKEVMENE